MLGVADKDTMKEHILQAEINVYDLWDYKQNDARFGGRKRRL